MKRNVRAGIAGVALLVHLLTAAGAAAQSPGGDARFGPVLARTLETASAAKNGADSIDVAVRTTDGPALRDALRAAGFSVHATFPRVVTARLAPEQASALASFPTVTSVEAAHELSPLNDVAAGMIGARALNDALLGGTAYTGDGVIVCVIDTGIDWDHGDFSEGADATQTRIRYLWDQTITATGSEQTPSAAHGGGDFSGFTYGVEYTEAHIEDELDGSPAGFVRQTDSDGHGTHVAGTAAGNGHGTTPARHAGMAPDADLVVVKGGNGSFSTTNIINGIAYCGAIADDLGRPVVVNMSLGGHLGAHDGTSTQETAVDDFVGAGKIAVISAGNEGDDSIHIGGTIADGATGDVQITIPTYSGTSGDDVEIDLWLSGAGNTSVTVTSPNSLTVTRTNGTQGTTTIADGSVYIYNIDDPTNGDRRVYVALSDGGGTDPVSGTWTISITNSAGASRDFDGWFVDRTLGAPTKTATLVGSDTDKTVGMPGTATGAITVGSWAHRWRWETSGGANPSYSGADRSDDLSSFSSIGPRRDGAQKPDIVGPGQGMASSKSSNSSTSSSRLLPGGQHYVIEGTSMSAPATSGAVALLLEASSVLTNEQIRTLLTDNATVDTYTGAVPNASWGYGKLDIFRAMADLLGGTGAREILAYDAWGSESRVELGSDADAVALRFTPSTTGRLTGLFFHAAEPDSNSLTGPLTASIWTDDGGDPGTQIASVSVDEDVVLDHAWNYVSFVAQQIDVVSGTNYHAVLTPTGGGDVELLFDGDGATTESGTARTRTSNGGVWSAASNDARMRPEVASASGLTLLPVELAAFTGYVDGDAAVLHWRTESERDNAGFEVHVRASDAEGAWRTHGFVAGAGTATGPRRYDYRAEGLGAGTYRFRLRQIDHDGAAVFGPELEVSVAPDGAFVLGDAYPNPFADRASFTLHLAETQRVRVSLYDVLGREVRRLHDGPLDGGRTHAFTVDGDGLAAGLYHYRVRGTSFSADRAVLRVR